MHYILLGLILLAGCSAWEPRYDTVAPPTNYQRGEDAMRRGELEMAARLFDTYVRETTDPTYRPRAYYQLARAYYGLGQYRNSLATLDKMESEFPEQRWAQTAALRGDTEWAIGNRTTGFLAWESAWQRGKEPDQAALRERMGRAASELTDAELRELEQLVVVPEVREMLKASGGAARLDAGSNERLVRAPAGRSGPPIGAEVGDPRTGAGSAAPPVGDDAYAPLGPIQPLDANPSGNPRLGALLPLTGAERHKGREALKGLRLAAADAPASVMLRDTGSDPAVAAQLFSHMAGDPSVLAIVAPLRGEEAAAIVPLAEQLGMPVFLPPDYTGPGGRFARPLNVTPVQEIRPLVAYAVVTLRAKRLGVLYPNDENGRAFTELFRTEAQNSGATIVGTKGYAPGKSEFAAEVAIVRRWESEGRLDAVFIPDLAQTAAVLGAALRARSPKLILLGTAAWNDEAQLEPAAKALEGAVFIGSDAAFGTSPSTRAGGGASEVEAHVFDTIMLGRRALESGAKTREQVLAQMLRFSTGGQQLLRLHDGKVLPITQATGES